MCLHECVTQSVNGVDRARRGGRRDHLCSDVHIVLW